MRKIFFTFIIFVTLIFNFSSPTYAITPEDWIKNAWGNVKGFFIPLFENYIAPKYNIEKVNYQIDTDYNSDNELGIAKKAIPGAMDENMKVQYIEAYLNGDYTNNAKLVTCNNVAIYLEDLIFYKLKNNSIQIDSNLKTTFLNKNSTKTLAASSDCYEDTWNKLNNVPIEKEKNSQSLQGNQIVKEIIPKNSQLSEITENKPLETTKEDTGAHTDLMYMNFIPQSAMPTSADERRILFTQLMWPASQQKK